MQHNINEFFKQKVPDLQLRRFIRGSIPAKGCFDSADNYYSLFLNILTISFFYAYSRYRAIDEDQIDELINNGNANSNRVINSFKKLYSNYSVTYDLIQYVLLDIQYDASNGIDDAILPQYMPDIFTFSSDFNIADYLIHITKWKKSSRYSGFSLDVAEKMFVNLINHLPFLQNYSIFIDADASDADSIIGFVDNRTGQEFTSNFSLIQQKLGEKEYSFYYLEGLEVKNSTLVLKYLNTEFTKSMVYIIGKNMPDGATNFIKMNYQAAYQEITNDELTKNQDFLRKEIDEIFTINYRYFRNLALAIADAIGLQSFSTSKTFIYNRFFKKCPNAFIANQIKSLDCFDEKNYVWDNVIVMLLIEISPSVVLNALISNNNNIFYKIVSNLNRRYNNSIPELSNKSQAELRKMAIASIDSSLTISSWIKNDPNAQTVKNKILASGMAQIIIKSLKVLEGNQNKQFDFEYTGNLQTNIEVLNKIKDNTDWNKKYHFIKITLGETLKRLICFYEGVFSYGKAKNDLESLMLNGTISAETLNKHQNIAENAFLESARRKYNELVKIEGCAENEIKPLYQEIIKLCEKCYTTDGNTRIIANEGKILYNILGRNEILDLNHLDDMIISGFGDEINEANINKAIDYAIKILRYIETGNDGATDMKTKHFYAIFPILSHYNKGNINKDGCSTATFSFTLDFNYNGTVDGKKDMMVLTEFEYELDQDYYCLPNVFRTNDRWWIDPLIVNCKKFNEIFPKKEE